MEISTKINESKIIQVKIIRHSNRLDFTNPIYWLFCFGQYWADSPLTKEGYNNAKLKAIEIANTGFVPRYIYASPYNRTMATSTEIKSVFPQADIKIEPLLSEYQPRSYHSITLYPKGIPTIYNGVETEFEYPESPEAFSRRAKFIITKLIETNVDNIMIVTHGEILKSFASYLQNLFPNLLLDPGNAPYLTTLSFSFDTSTKEFIPTTIKIE